MRYNIFFIIILACLLLGQAQAQMIVNSWRDPDAAVHSPGIHKIVVAALIRNPSVRKDVEDYMVSLSPVKAVQSYRLTVAAPLTDSPALYKKMLCKLGFDGIVLLRQTSENVGRHYMPGPFPVYYQSWETFWQWGWKNSHLYPTYRSASAYLGISRPLVIQVAMYSMNPDKLVWSAGSNITSPGVRFAVFRDICDDAYIQMECDGLLNW